MPFHTISATRKEGVCANPDCGKLFYFYPRSDRHNIYCSKTCSGIMHSTSLAERFWKHVNKDGPIPPHCPELGPCWLWTVTTDKRGYGRIMGEQRGHTVPRVASRVSWELQNGPIPEGMLVCHNCDNPTCVRPDHLFLGTAYDNAHDMDSKGRSRFRGEQHGNAKFTVSDILEIRSSELTQTALARIYGVHPSTISNVISRKHWFHVL